MENHHSAFNSAVASIGVSSGRWYWEVLPRSDLVMQIGVIAYGGYEFVDFGKINDGRGIGDLPGSWAIDLVRHYVFAEGEAMFVPFS